MSRPLSLFLFLALFLNAFVCSGCLTNTDKVPPPKEVYKYRYKQVTDNALIEVKREGSNARVTVLFKIKDVKKRKVDVEAKNEVRSVRFWGKKLTFIYDPTPRDKPQVDKDVITIKVLFSSRDKFEFGTEITIKVSVSVGLWDLVEVKDVESEVEELGSR